MAEKHLQKCSKSLVIMKMQIKMTPRFYLIPIIMAKIKNSGDSTCWQECGERGTLPNAVRTAIWYNHSGNKPESSSENWK